MKLNQSKKLETNIVTQELRLNNEIPYQYQYHCSYKELLKDVCCLQRDEEDQ